MSSLQIRSNNMVQTNESVENGASEAVNLIQERANTSNQLLKSFKERNTTLFAKILNSREAKVIGKAEVDIIVKEFEAQNRELEAIQTGRLKALQKVLESKLMYMNTTLQVDLSRAFKYYETILLKTLNESEAEFQEIIENFESKIGTYKNEKMKERALKDLDFQMECFYRSKEKLVEEYTNLIENQKFSSK